MVTKSEHRINPNIAAGEASSLVINMCSSKKSSPTEECEHRVLSKCPSSSSTITFGETAPIYPKLHDGIPDQRYHRSVEGDLRNIRHPLLYVYTTKEPTKKDAVSSNKKNPVAGEKSCKTSHRQGVVMLISSNKTNTSVAHQCSSSKNQLPIDGINGVGSMETPPVLTEPNNSPLEHLQEEKNQRDDVDAALENEDPGFFEGAQRGFAMAYHDVTSDLAFFCDTSNDRVWSL